MSASWRHCAKPIGWLNITMALQELTELRLRPSRPKGWRWLHRLRVELIAHHYRPTRLRRVAIPKRGESKELRVLSIPTIRDRVVQGALKLILEPSPDTFASLRYCL